MSGIATAGIDGAQRAPQKVDPETLVLRAKPARAIRFKRGVVVSLAALTSASIVVTAWLALRPTSFEIVGQNDDRTEVGKAPLDTLSGLPATYGEAPKLGPPLPGDLGRPILAHQRAMSTDAGGSVDAGQQAKAAERERALAERRAARESGIMAKTSGSVLGPAVAMPQIDERAVPPETERTAISTDHDPNGQSRKLDFVATADRGGQINPHRLSALASPNTLLSGSVIAASLITGLRSDLPGLVTAQVTERVYDTATGRTLLIPQGARLIGSYDSVVAFGQRRALVVWQRIILPDGSSLVIDNAPASDPSGYVGLADEVDFHTWTLIKGVAISTLLGVGSSLSFSGESDLIQAIRESTQQNASRAGDQLTSRNLQIQPTITVRPGARVRLVVHRDLVLAPWRE